MHQIFNFIFTSYTAPDISVYNRIIFFIRFFNYRICFRFHAFHNITLINHCKYESSDKKTKKKVETKQTPAQPVGINQPSVTPSQPTSNGNTINAQPPQKEEQTKILRVTYWVKCDCGKELTHSIDYKDYESYYNSNDYSVKILINQLLDEGHCAGNEEVCGASHYRYGTNENWIYK